jgi:hypothetical protein
LPALAESINQTILEVEETLNRWDRENLLVFRSFERGYVIWPQDRLYNESDLDLEAQPMSAHQNEKADKLQQMIEYAESLSVGHCRKRYVLRYFGEEPDWIRCGACDHCPPLEVPWATTSVGELPKISDYVDPASIILEAHRWNTQRADRLDRQPKGHTSIERWLVGDEWFGKAPKDFPYADVLSQLGDGRPGQGRDAIIERLTQRLVREGYLARQTAEAEIDGQLVTWTYYEVTPAGEAVRGTAFGWD